MPGFTCKAQRTWSIAHLQSGVVDSNDENMGATRSRAATASGDRWRKVIGDDDAEIVVSGRRDQTQLAAVDEEDEERPRVRAASGDRWKKLVDDSDAKVLIGNADRRCKIKLVIPLIVACDY